MVIGISRPAVVGGESTVHEAVAVVRAEAAWAGEVELLE